MASSQLVAPELAAIKVQGVTREAFLIRATLAAGATYGAMSATPFITRALAESDGDVDILNYALTLEYLEAEFYTLGVKQVKGLSSDEMKLAKEIRDNEDEHVDALAATVKKLGGKAVAKPTFDFGGAFGSRAVFLKTANVLEDARRQRLQRRRPAHQVGRRPGRGRQHRADRGAPRGPHPPRPQQAAGAAGVRQGGDDGRDPQEGHAVHQVVAPACRQVALRGARRAPGPSSSYCEP